MTNKETAKFWSLIEKGVGDDCWMWRGSLQAMGYGQILLEEGRRRPHRLSYEIAKGPIPDGLVLDHLCRTPACVNPLHLEAVTHKENAMRGEAPCVVSRRWGVCVSGRHLMDEANTYIIPKGDGKRGRCRACAAEYQRGYVRIENRSV